ncbi:MAG: flagellin [Candidatus Sphingomonas colombiensis]|nr:flagellin [Sphingomonas sp.]WEK44685.1 MAG: flagellin [Sphingomonas sp.]
MTIAPSTNLFYDRSASSMSSLTAQIARANQQITAQTNILAPSDNSVAWQRLQDLSRADANDAAYTGNVSIAKSVLAQSDTALGQIGDQLQQVSTLLVQAASGTITPSGKAAIASQLSDILTTIVTTANANDIRGGPLFGGSAGGMAVVQNSDGSLSFGTGEAASIPIGDGQSVQSSNNAAGFLKTDTSDLGTAIAAIMAALNTNTDIPASATDTLKKVSDQVIGTQASVGARAARVDIVAGQIESAKIDRSAARTDVDGFDYSTAITELQKTMTVLQATQASFSKLSGMSLFDYLR